MKKGLLILLAVCALAACSKRTEGGSSRLKEDTDSIAYVIGMNVGLNLMEMDSTMNVSALCEGIRDVFRKRTRLTVEEAETYYLSYVTYLLPEKAQAYEEQFLADVASSNRAYARTKTGITYTIEQVGDQERIPASDRDSLSLRMRVRSTDDRELYASTDTLRLRLDDLVPALRESVKLIGEGGKIEAWCPSKETYGREGSEEFHIAPNQTVCFEVELIKLDKYVEWNRRLNFQR